MNPAPLGARSRETPGSAISAALMRLAVASGMLPEGRAGEAAGAALVASVLSSTPHRIILLDVAGDAGVVGGAGEQAPGAGLRITSLALVIEIWTGADHTALRNTVRAALVDHDARAGAGAQRAIDLPGGRAAMAYTRPDWPAWREVAWYSEEGRFIVTIGEGAMARWLEQRDRAYLRDPWADHRRHHFDWLNEARGGGGGGARPARVAELGLDLDRFRRGFPDAIAEGLAGQFLRAWGLSNARSFMLHAQLVAPGEIPGGGPTPGAVGAPDPARAVAVPGGPAMLALSATWSSRAEAPLSIHHKPVALPVWPEALGAAPAEAPWACALALNWPAAISRALATWGASMPLDERRRVGPTVERWLRQHNPRLSRILAMLDPAAAVIAPAPPADGWPPLGAMVIAPARVGMEAEDLEAHISTLMRSLPGARFDPDTGTWAVGLLPEPLDPTGALGQLAWGVGERAGRAVIVAAAGGDARRQVAEARGGGGGR